MKTIKINFTNFWSSFKKEDNLFYRILSKHFDVEISEDPDFVICSNRGDLFEYMKYDCVRIMFMGENMSPDWTAIDYCLGFDFMNFGDRYFRLPYAFYFDDAKPIKFSVPTHQEAEKILASKKFFCNFIYGHPSDSQMREKLFKRLSEYKPVISPGNYLKNFGDDSKGRCSWQEKHDYLKLSKFTIACDSINYPGFVTEKIVDPFKYNSIPIYSGSPNIDYDFNTDSFVWCKSEADIDAAVEKVIYLDNNNDAYIDMLMQQPLLCQSQEEERYENLEKWLVNIFSQSPEDAKRRIHNFAAARHEEALMKQYQNNKSNTLNTLFRSIKKRL